MKDPYLYPNNETLINLFNEADEKRFSDIEADYTSLRIKELLDKPIMGSFDLQHLCSIHQYVFQDVFSWAGKLRIINIEKTEEALSGLSVEYSDVFDIVRHAESALSKMASTPGMPKEQRSTPTASCTRSGSTVTNVNWMHRA